MKIKKAEDLSKLRESIKKKRDKGRRLVTVCGGTGCRAYGCDDLISALKQEVERSGLKGFELVAKADESIKVVIEPQR